MYVIQMLFCQLLLNNFLFFINHGNLIDILFKNLFFRVWEHPLQLSSTGTDYENFENALKIVKPWR